MARRTPTPHNVVVMALLRVRGDVSPHPSIIAVRIRADVITPHCLALVFQFVLKCLLLLLHLLLVREMIFGKLIGDALRNLGILLGKLSVHADPCIVSVRNQLLTFTAVLTVGQLAIVQL